LVRGLLVLPLIVFGCDEGSGPGLFKEKTATGIDTLLSAERIVAGGRVDVSCLVHFDDGTSAEMAPPAIGIGVTPEGTTLEGAQLSSTRAGTYTVQCDLAGVSATLAKLEVTAAAAKVSVAAVDPATIASGEKSTASCRVEDQYGNAIDAPAQLSIDPADGVELNGFEILGIIAREYTVRCDAGGGVQQVPATLKVTPGEPTQLVARVDPQTAPAGTHIDVTCELTDAAGNPIAEMPASIDVTPSPTMSDALGFTPTIVGEYAVSCSSGALISETVIVTIEPAAPATIEIITVDPTLPVYPRRTVVELTARITDAYGNEITTEAWSLESDPPEAAQNAGLHRLELVGNGPVTLIARVVSTPTVEDRVVLLVDGDLPVVVIDTPARAAIIQGPPGQAIAISGHVSDPTSNVASLTIEGTPITIAADGSFSTSIAGRWGINIFEGSAIDDAGNERMFAQSFELASQYRQVSDARIVSGRIDDGLMVRLSQPALDDNTSTVDDLATIARLAIQQADIASLIPDPVTTYNSDCSIPFVTIRGSLRLHVDNVTFGTPIIDITAINGGLHLRAEIPNLRVDMHTTGDVCDIGIGVSGNATATRAIVEGDIQVWSSGGNVMVAMPQPSVSLSGFAIDLDLPSIIDWAVDGIISLFSGAIRSRVESALADVIQDEVPPLVDDFLSSLTFGTSVQIPAPISLSLGINARLGSIAFAPGGGNLGFDTSLFATGALSPEPLGGILQEFVVPAALDGRGELAVGLSYDLVNQALYSIWYGGGLSLDIADFVGSGQQISGVTAAANGLLPLVIAPGTDPSYPLELALGDLELAVDVQGVQGLPPIAATIYASAIAQARVSVNASGDLEFELAPSARVALDFATTLDDTIDLPMLVTELETLFMQLLPMLFNEGIGGVPIPTLDLSSLAGTVLPSGIRLGLGNPQTEVQASYLVLGGRVVAVP
jgi:hypothetical protein